MGLVEAVKSVLGQYATFTGRARRSEYWMFVLFTAIIHGVFWILMIITSVGTAATATASGEAAAAFGGLTALIGIVWMLVVFALMVPSYSVWARRLHDMGQSGHWLWLNFVSLGIVPMVMAFMDSQPGPNQWGPSPKVITYTTPMDHLPADYPSADYPGAPTH